MLNTSEKSKSIVKKDVGNLIVDLELTHVNVFIMSSSQEYIVLRLNILKFQQNAKVYSVITNGFKITTAKGQSVYNCICTEHIRQYKACITKFHLDLIKDVDYMDVTLKFLDEIVIYWCTNIHLKILTFLREVDDFVTMLKEALAWRPNNTNSNYKKIYNLHIYGQFNFFIRISNKHYVKIDLDELHFGNKKNVAVLNNNIVKISIDDAEIFTIQGTELIKVNNHLGIREERADYEHFELPWNKTWGLTINSFKACFPYEHNYADAIQNEFISVFKWLKTVHNVKKMPLSAKTPLPSDLLINVNQITFNSFKVYYV